MVLPPPTSVSLQSRGDLMPLVRVSLRHGRSAEFKHAVGDAIHQAMVETADVPPQDRFQIITEHDEHGLIYDPEYLGITRTDAIVLIQITLNQGRTLEVKKALFARIADQLHTRLGIRKEDVFVNLVEVLKENWSFGNGVAQYAQ
jgi:4-oxalocrotonate tautomerase